MFNDRSANFTLIVSLSLFVVLVFINIFIFGHQYRRNKNIICGECNVIIIDIDVLRADAIDCINRSDQTPNICKFASDSIVFNNNISQGLFTKTSNVSMMTSTYPVTHQIWSQIDDIADVSGKLSTLTEVLKLAGYVTNYYGQLNDLVSTMKGFDSQVQSACVVCEGFFPAKYVLPNNNSDRFFAYIYLDDLHFPYLLKNNKTLTNYPDAPTGIPTTISDYVEIETEFLAKNYKKVFTEDFIKTNKNIFKDPEKNKYKIFNLVTREGKDKYNYLKDIAIFFEEPFFERINPNNSKDVEYIKQSYLLVLENIDRSLGSFLNLLEQDPYKNNTIIILRSDHGEEFFEHGQFSHHNDLYQELIHTPLMIKVPGLGSKNIESLTMDIDIMPTILNLLNLNVPITNQGISLLPLIEGKSTSIRDYQIAQQGDNDDYAAYRKGEWKILIRKSTPIGLYNLKEDPLEKNNLISKNLWFAQELYKSYMEIISPLPKITRSNDSVPLDIDKNKLERLKKEGYF